MSKTSKLANTMDDVRELTKREAVQEPAWDPTHAVFCGLFVECAYSMYEGQPNNPTPAPSLPPGYELVAWVQMRDFLVGEGDWTFYGVIAANTANKGEHVLAIRGTEGWIEWLDDATSMALFPMPPFGQVGYGFHRIYQTLRLVDPQRGSLERAGSFARQVDAAIRHHAAKAEKKLQVEVTGHSLGAALATLYVADHYRDPKFHISLICTFASPKVGDPDFAASFNKIGIPSWRIVNEPDIVPTLPFFPWFQHVQTEHRRNAASSVIWTLACFHYLETYLHMLDPRQPLKKECIWSPRLGSRASLMKPAGTATAAPTRKEVVLSSPHEDRTTINITINKP